MSIIKRWALGKGHQTHTRPQRAICSSASFVRIVLYRLGCIRLVAVKEAFSSIAAEANLGLHLNDEYGRRHTHGPTLPPTCFKLSITQQQGAIKHRRISPSTPLYQIRIISPMKFTNSLILASLCATTAFAQRISIGFPSDGATIAAGSKLTVEIDRPVRISIWTRYNRP